MRGSRHKLLLSLLCLLPSFASFFIPSLLLPACLRSVLPHVLFLFHRFRAFLILLFFFFFVSSFPRFIVFIFPHLQFLVLSSLLVSCFLVSLHFFLSSFPRSFLSCLLAVDLTFSSNQISESHFSRQISRFRTPKKHPKKIPPFPHSTGSQPFHLDSLIIWGKIGC